MLIAGSSPARDTNFHSIQFDYLICMIRLLGKLPNKVILACSGGVDSMAVLSFLRNSKREIIVCFVNHDTDYSDKCESFLKEYCKANNIHLVVGRITELKDPKKSQEEFWRDERYHIFKKVSELHDCPVITCHHLGDVVETWIFGCLNGTGKLIPYKRDFVIRPFLLNKKEVFIKWCIDNEVPWLDDPSNKDSRYNRNLIRNELLPIALRVNPGIHKVIYKKILSEFNLK